MQKLENISNLCLTLEINSSNMALTKQGGIKYVSNKTNSQVFIKRVTSET